MSFHLLPHLDIFLTKVSTPAPLLKDTQARTCARAPNFYFEYFLLIRLNIINFSWYAYFKDRLCGVVVRVPGYRSDIYCVTCEVRTEFIYVMQKKVDRLCGLVVRVPGNTKEIVFPVRYELNVYMLCRRE
jgi:hypothetical protein